MHASTAPKEGLLRPLRRSVGAEADEKAGAPARFIYSLETIDQLDDRGRSKRGMGEKLPDFFSLSQSLRAVGAVIDAKRGQLVELSRKAEVDSIPAIVVRYLTLSGSYVSEEHSTPALYDRSVHLYKSRRPADASGDLATPPQDRTEDGDFLTALSRFSSPHPIPPRGRASSSSALLILRAH